MKRYDINLIRSVGVALQKTVFGNQELYTDGYLIEKRPHKEIGPDKDGNPIMKEDGCDIIALSLVGTKTKIEKFLKRLEEDVLAIQKNDKTGPIKEKDDVHEIHTMKRVSFNQLPLSLLETEQVLRNGISMTIEGPGKAVDNVIAIYRPDVESVVRIREGSRANFFYYGNESEFQDIHDRVKKEGCTVAHCREITEGTLFKRCIMLNPKCRPDHLDGDSKEAYLIGETVEEARSQFWSVLDRLTPPFQPEWEETIWNEFRRRGWVEMLEGHRLIGFKLHIDQEKLLEMLSEAVNTGSLRVFIPEEENTDEPVIQDEAA